MYHDVCFVNTGAIGVSLLVLLSSMGKRIVVDNGLSWVTRSRSHVYYIIRSPVNANTFQFLSLNQTIHEPILLNFIPQNVQAGTLTLPSCQTLTDKKARSHSRLMARYKVGKLHTTPLELRELVKLPCVPTGVNSRFVPSTHFHSRGNRIQEVF